MTPSKPRLALRKLGLKPHGFPLNAKTSPPLPPLVFLVQVSDNERKVPPAPTALRLKISCGPRLNIKDGNFSKPREENTMDCKLRKQSRGMSLQVSARLLHPRHCESL